MISHFIPSSSVSRSRPTAGGSRIQSRLIFIMLLVVLTAIFLLEALYRSGVGQADPWQTAVRMLVSSAIIIALAVGLALYVARGWAKQATAIKETLDALASGDSDARVEIFREDELGEIAMALNRWRDEAADVATSAQEGEHTIGSPKQLVDAAQRLSTSVNSLRASTEKLSRESEADLAQITDTSSAVDEIVESIRQVADNTSTSADVATEARETAIVGSQAVSNTIKGMQRIRSQVQSTSKRIKQLGESTQQIGEIVQLISDVADRTSLLALNASIQAATAGEAGRGFGVVAEEVERLSQRCNEATKQMAKLVKSVQSEAAEAIAGMEESIVEVVEGSKLASQAGEALADIDAVSDRLAGLINSISSAAKQQVRGGLLASRSMNEISAVIHDKALETKQAAQSVAQLAALADGLFTTVQEWHQTSETPPETDNEANCVAAAQESTTKCSPPAPPAEPSADWGAPVPAGSASPVPMTE